MMLEEELSRNIFFAKAGAYSINPDSVSCVRESLNYTIEILEQNIYPKPVVFFFPQGILLPWYKRPLNFKRGIEFILRHIHTPINLCFLGIKAEFLNEQRPEVFFQFGNNRIYDHTCRVTAQELETEAEIILHAMENRIINKERGEILLQGKQSINTMFFKIRSSFGKSKIYRG